MKLLLVAPLFFLFGCSSQVVRQTKVFHAETLVMSQAALQAAGDIKALIPKGCVCSEGSFVDSECKAAAKRALVIETRIPRIRDNMLYLAGVLKERPPKDLPEVPDPNILCPPEE